MYRLTERDRSLNPCACWVCLVIARFAVSLLTCLTVLQVCYSRMVAWLGFFMVDRYRFVATWCMSPMSPIVNELTFIHSFTNYRLRVSITHISTCVDTALHVCVIWMVYIWSTLSALSTCAYQVSVYTQYICRYHINTDWYKYEGNDNETKQFRQQSTKR